LLDLDADAERVDRALDQDALTLRSRNRQGREDDLLACTESTEKINKTHVKPKKKKRGLLGLDLGLVVTLDDLRRKVLEAHGRIERRTDSLEVGGKCSRLWFPIQKTKK